MADFSSVPIQSEEEGACPRAILVVDADPGFADSLRGLLEPHGYRLLVARDAEAAIAVLRDRTVSVALLDIQPGPVGDGDLLARLQRERRNLIGVMMTAHADTETAVKAMRTGAYDYIEKSCHPTEMLAVLDRCFEKLQLQQDREAAYDALRQAKEEAEAASRAKSEFLATMSHELRTPLNAIIGFSEVMMAETFGPLGTAAYAGYVRDINSSGNHLLSLINDILDLSKAEAGRLELTEETVDLGRLIEGVLRLVQPRAEGAGVKVAAAIDPGMPYLLADERKIRQILLNLLSNAVKFTPAGGRVDVGTRLDDAGRIILTVADTGVGIADADIATAFEPFRQIDNALNRRYEGTGLGLPLVATMVALHGGEIALASQPGTGTTVTVTFPAERVAAASEAAE